MTNYTVKATINLDAFRGELQRSLQKTIHLVSAGLQMKEQIDPERLHLPTSNMTMIFDSRLNWDAEEVQKHYGEWVVSNGFRDIIEGINAFLETAHQVLSLWEILEKQKRGEQITGGDYNEFINLAAKKFHWLGLLGKLEHLETNHNIVPEPKFREQVVGVNRARNCLVHRGGIVGSEDTNNNNILEVKWTKFLLVTQDEHSEREVVAGIVLRKGDVITSRNIEESKTFSQGEQVIITAEEFGNIAWTLFLFGSDLVQKIINLGLENGFLKESTAST